MSNPDPQSPYTSALLQAWHGTLAVSALVDCADHLAQQPEHLPLVAVLYRTWLARNLTQLNFVIWFNLGVTLSLLNDDAAARDAHLESIALAPNFAQSRISLGLIYEKLAQDQLAIEQWTSVTNRIEDANLEERTNLLTALNHLGRFLETKNNYHGAMESLNRSLSIEPNQPDVIHHLIFIRAKQCVWPVYAPIAGIEPQTMRKCTSALALLSLSDDPAEQRAVAESHAQKKFNPELSPLSDKRAYGHEKLRIGYLSSDFCLHPVSMLMVELFEQHDRSQVEVYGFCWSREDGSALRARVIRAFDHFERIGPLTDEHAAQLIRQHEIDILVDLQGQTLGARPVILAYRPAPVHITYLGLPGSTGLKHIDYVIADRFIIPEDAAQFYTEKPLYMPDVYQVSDRRRVCSPPPSRQGCGLPEAGFVFCSMNNNYKFTPEMFDVWMNILRRVPDSVLWLLEDNEWSSANLRNEAAARGMEQHRIVFSTRTTPEDYLARYLVADLFLDTYPFNAGTTANDALWMGMPLLTCTGQSFAARMAGALLTAAQLPELITYNFADYEDRAVELANNPGKCAAMRSHLAHVRETGGLFDTRRFARALEQQLRQLVASLP